MQHKHRIKPGYEGGAYEDGNVVLLTPTQHAMWHFAEWQRKGKWEDRVAWRALAGLASKEEVVATVLSEAGKKGGAWNKDPRNRELKRSLSLGQKRSSKAKAKMAVSQQHRVERGDHPFLSSPTWDRKQAAAKAVETRRRSCRNYQIVQENLQRIIQWAEEAKDRKIRGRRPGRTACNKELRLNLTDTHCLRAILDKLNDQL